MRSRGWIGFVLPLSLALLSGCGPQTRTCVADCKGGPPPMGSNLVLTPSSAMLTVKGGPATQQFTATWNGMDVTSQVTWSAPDQMIGSINASGLLTVKYPLPYGGATSITANYNGNVGVASVLIDYFAPDVLDVSAPPNAVGAFGGPASTDANEYPRIVYPFSQAMLARNINQMNIQWFRSPKDNVFRIHIVGATIDIAFYLGRAACGLGNQCQFRPHDVDWQTVAVSASGQPVQLTIDGTAGAGQPVASSRPVTLDFSPDDVKGGLYYFSPSIKGLKRLPFGASTATDFVSQGGGTGCTGCHAVSRDGKKVASTFYSADCTGGMVDGANGQKFLITPEQCDAHAARRWNFATFNPDGTLLLTNWAGDLVLRDGATGKRLSVIPGSQIGGRGKAVMPEWSPDGSAIVFVQLPTEGKLGKELSSALIAGDWIVGNGGSIAVMPYNSGMWGPAQVVAPSVAMHDYNIYPSWSPDSQWIVFATMKYPGSSPTADINLRASSTGYVMSYDQDTARLRLVQASGGAIIELPSATHLMNKTTSWPKFAPFIQKSGSLVFFTFSAKFDYGFVVTGGYMPQLWMAAIDLDKARSELGGADPSYPPFWLPFQSPTESNHSGIWTTDVACSNQGSGDCPAEFSCQNGVCVKIMIM